MKIERITLNAIRNFQSTVTFNLSNSKQINTISGKNGSGKTTIFKSMLLCQKAYFCELTYDGSVRRSISRDLARYFTSNDSYIEIEFTFEEDTKNIANLRLECESFTHDYVNWRLVCSEKDNTLIEKHWNIQKPTNIIAYIESSKFFVESDVTYDNISIKKDDDYSRLIIDVILHPEMLFSNIFQRLVNDYIHERLVPAKPRREIYFTATKILLARLLPHLSFSNFTANTFPNQFVLLAKTTQANKSNYYDVRNLSSGEKTLFYLLLFINYVQNIGMIIIDEPENHFHEDLLVRFITLLNEISAESNYADFLITVASSGKIILSDTNKKELRSMYSSYNLSQIFLLTHSKNLIYNNFSFGTNYFIDNALHPIDYNNIERTLRKIGISSIYSKVLFVEGTTETDFLSFFLNDYNIKVHPLNGCEQVIETYKKLVNIKKHLTHNHFCFLIDRDTRSIEEVEALRKVDRDFFDNHFYVLDKHEFENYLLDPKIYKTLIQNHSALFSEIETITENEIEQKLKEIATSTKSIVIKKALQHKNGNTIGLLKESFRKKAMPVDEETAYQTYIDDIIHEIDINKHLKMKFMDNYQSTISEYSEDNWNREWSRLCDGKKVLTITINYFASYLKIDAQRLRREIKTEVIKNPSIYEVNKIIQSIILKFT